MTHEQNRLLEIKQSGKPWQKWGSYLSERQWGTVREDYSKDGTAWDYFPFRDSMSRAYRWGEDGIGGISDDQQYLCFAPAFWNGRDPLIKERFFGLNNEEGNHGEDVKEYYYYLDNTPTHSYMKMLYKYPQGEFPYEKLQLENKKRTRNDPEYELIDTGIFNDNRYFDVFIEYAKNDIEDILIHVTIHNMGADEAPLTILPHLWFRNTWSWHHAAPIPFIKYAGNNTLIAEHPVLGSLRLYFEGNPEALFCDNETNDSLIFGVKNPYEYVKDGINNYIISGRRDTINPKMQGSKSALAYKLNIAAGTQVSLRFRLTGNIFEKPWDTFDFIMGQRKFEADEYYNELLSNVRDEDSRSIARQAFAGMLWNKQYYYYDVEVWLKGDPAQPPPPNERRQGRNCDWEHLNNADIISMPDKWEYPWYATWDLAFHCVALAWLDPEFAKEQLVLFTREWYMHPNGQLPAYEWNFSDVNPPLHAWAALKVYQIDEEKSSAGDTDFLERVFHKLLINFTWWINKKDKDDRNIFQGGFLGLDNIGVFDRSKMNPATGFIDQTDGTAWMAMYCLNLMRIALELAKTKAIYQDLATKFFEHFLYIAYAMTNVSGKNLGLWNEENQFFFDVMHSGEELIPIEIFSLVGLIPLFAVEILESSHLKQVPEFEIRLKWFLENKPELASLVSRWHEKGKGESTLLSLLRGHRMQMLLRRMLDPGQFLSDYGVRSLSKYHERNPFTLKIDGEEHVVHYTPGESDVWLFGGNSNWRGPVWFPMNYMLIDSLRKFYAYYGDEFKIEYPSYSKNYITINQVADELTKRLIGIFHKDDRGKRPVYGYSSRIQDDPAFSDHILFHEYFHGDSGRGAGASHQTGWTGLVALLIKDQGE